MRYSIGYSIGISIAISAAILNLIFGYYWTAGIMKINDDKQMRLKQPQESSSSSSSASIKTELNMGGSGNSKNLQFSKIESKKKQDEDGYYWIYDKGMNGLGHRLSRLAGAFHIAVRSARNNGTEPIISHIEPDWNNCMGYPPFPNDKYKSYIWEMLFGPGNITVPSTFRFHNDDGVSCASAIYNNKSMHDKNKALVCNNGCPGYNTQSTKPRNFFRSYVNLIDSKVQTDAYLYSYLQSRFKEQHDHLFKTFFNKYNFKEYFVIGLHLRIGSKKDDHFHFKNRALDNQHAYCTNIIQLIYQIMKDRQKQQQQHDNNYNNNNNESKLKFMLFVATDNQDIITIMNETIYNQNIPIILATNYQPNQLEFDGFDFYNNDNDSNKTTYKYDACVENWRNSMMDMVLLSMTDLVIAGMYSSYVQTMPLSLAFDQQYYNSLFNPYYSDNTMKIIYTAPSPSPSPSPSLFPVYCEVSLIGNAATCHSAYESTLHHTYTKINETTFLYGMNSQNWSYTSRHVNKLQIPVGCGFCEPWPFLCLSG